MSEYRVVSERPSGAKARTHEGRTIAALKRCATQNRDTRKHTTQEHTTQNNHFPQTFGGWAAPWNERDADCI